MHGVPAYIKADGTEIPGTDSLTRDSTIMCLGLGHDTPPGNLKGCHIKVPGFDGDVEVQEKVGSTGAGTIIIHCRGTAPTACMGLIMPNKTENKAKPTSGN
jgi:hypothetical protein